jgi:hypothetical protein
MSNMSMPTETAAGISIGIKSGLFAAFVAVLTELLGFAIVPLAPGWEMLVGFWVVAGVMKWFTTVTAKTPARWHATQRPMSLLS